MEERMLNRIKVMLVAKLLKVDVSELLNPTLL